MIHYHDTLLFSVCTICCLEVPSHCKTLVSKMLVWSRLWGEKSDNEKNQFRRQAKSATDDVQPTTLRQRNGDIRRHMIMISQAVGFTLFYFDKHFLNIFSHLDRVRWRNIN